MHVFLVKKKEEDLFILELYYGPRHSEENGFGRKGTKSKSKGKKGKDQEYLSRGERVHFHGESLLAGQKGGKDG